MSSRRGFTIVELLIVIVVIGVLAALVITAYSGIQQRATVTAVTSDLSAAKRSFIASHAQDGSYPSLYAPAYTATEFQVSSDSTGFCITATRDTVSYKVTEVTMPAEGGCPGHAQGGKPALTNLAPNPSAETNLGWHSNNGAVFPRSFDTSTARSGSQSIVAYNLSDGTALLSLYGAGALNGNGFPITGGTYTGSAYFKADVASKGRVRASYYAGGSWQQAPLGPWFSYSGSGWQRAHHTFVVPDEATLLRMGVEVYADATVPAGTKAWTDDMLVTEGAQLYEYGDGDAADWVWNGDPHKSVSRGPQI